MRCVERWGPAYPVMPIAAMRTLAARTRTMLIHAAMIPSVVIKIVMIPATKIPTAMIRAAGSLAAGSLAAGTLAAVTLALPAQAFEACPAAPHQVLRLPATRAAVTAGEPLVIVAFGSSSTAGSGATTAAHTYPARLEATLRAAWPKLPVTVLNLGRGGETTAAMLARLDRDVLAANPTLVIWQLGANAAMRQLDPMQFEILTRAGIDAITRRGIDLVIMDNQRAPRILSQSGHETYGDILARVAVGHGTSLFSRWALMRAWEQRGPAGPPMISADGVHHTDRGYACVAEALGRSILAAAGSPSQGQ